MSKIQFSLIIEEELLKELKFLSINEGNSISSEIEELLIYGIYIDHILRHGKEFNSIEFNEFVSNKHLYFNSGSM